MTHAAFTTAWTYAYIIIPDWFHYFWDCNTGELWGEFLMPLNAEDDTEVFLFVTVVQKTIVPDFLKPIWEYMHHQAAYKFIRWNVNNDFFTGPVIFSPKWNLFTADRDNAWVCNGYAVGIPAEVFNGISEAIEGFFYVGTPFLFIKSIPVLCPCVRVTKSFTWRRKNKSALSLIRIQAGKEFTTEFRTQNLHRNEKFVRWSFEPVIFGQTTTCNNAVDMWMVIQSLSPCMKNLDNARCCSEILFVRWQFQKCFRGASV